MKITRLFGLIPAILLIIFIASCGGNSSENNKAKENNENNENLEFNPSIFSKNDYVGEIKTGKVWQDKTGKNYLVVSEKTTTNSVENENGPEVKSYEIHFYHYVDDNGNLKLIREVKDFENKCGFSLECGLVDNSIDLTDLDNDGNKEISFIYYLSCSSELSPRQMKLMILEEGEKYPIRGTSYADYGFQITGGQTGLGDELKNAPKEFKEFALKKWKETRYKFSGIEGDHLKFVQFWEQFIDAIRKNDKTGLSKISKTGQSFGEIFFKDLQKDVDKISIENVKFEENNMAKMTLLLTMGTCYFTFELIDGQWYLKEFNAAG